MRQRASSRPPARPPRPRCEQASSGGSVSVRKGSAAPHARLDENDNHYCYGASNCRGLAAARAAPFDSVCPGSAVSPRWLRPPPSERRKQMSLDVSPELLDQARKGTVDEAAFV